ncbi:hypothetical protein QTP86_021211 [Hemibagrus guttatus]|nr:hypothetical protein QTP86_021211 [Hemibagrus guttatus]
MDCKILLLVLCITFTSVQGAIPPCCIATAPIRPRLLGRMENFTIQNRNGRCEIDAIVKGIRTSCADQLVRCGDPEQGAAESNFF